MPPFKEKVYQIVSQIPKGKVATYKDIAILAGSPGAARAIGTCMKNNLDTKTVPCHRVVGSDGKMHGYAFGQGVITKLEKLKEEGIEIKNETVDLGKYRWSGTLK